MGQDSQEGPVTLLPSFALSHAFCSLPTRNPAVSSCTLPVPSSNPAGSLPTHTNQQSHASESRAHCVPSCHGRAGGAEEGRRGSGSREAVTATASGPGRSLRRIPAPPRPQGLGRCSAAPGRGASAAQNSGSFARCSLTTVTGDTMAAVVAAAGTRLWATVVRMCLRPGEEATR